MTKSSFVRTLGILSVMTFGMASVEQVYGDSYDAGAALRANETTGPLANPNGPWSYGYTGTEGGALTLYTAAENTTAWEGNSAFAGYFLSNGGDNVPVIAVNVTGSPSSPCCGVDNVAPGKIFIHPGPSGSSEFDVVRWTAPITGVIDISASWLKLDTGTDQLDILHNSNTGSPIYDHLLTGARGTSDVVSEDFISVTAGDTIDFSLGFGPTFGSNSLQFDALIGYVPEPSSVVALCGLGAMGLFFAIRRRRKS